MTIIRIRSSFLFCVGKLDFHHELEKFSQTYNIFFATYNKLKKFWNLAARSTHVNVIIQSIVKQGVKLPAATRWNSEWDSMEDVFQKKAEVGSMFRIIMSMTYSRSPLIAYRLMRFLKSYRKLDERNSKSCHR